MGKEMWVRFHFLLQLESEPSGTEGSNGKHNWNSREHYIPIRGKFSCFIFHWTGHWLPGRRRCMVAASKTEIIIILHLLEANLVNFRSKLRKLRSRNGKTLLFLNCAQRCRKKCNSQHEQKRLGLTSVMPVN